MFNILRYWENLPLPLKSGIPNIGMDSVDLVVGRKKE